MSLSPFEHVVAQVVVQAGLAAAWYVGVLLLLRLLGKRFAGQVTGFDLLVLITLAVVLQTALLREGTAQALTFVVVVAGLHVGAGRACRASPTLRRLLRGAPRTLVTDGVIDGAALAGEGLGPADLEAGLRKHGVADVADVALAVLEETGEISVLRKGG